MRQISKTWLAALMLLLSISCKKEGINIQSSGVTDNTVVTHSLLNDDKVPIMDTVKIGNQVWMSKNLDIRRYRNGDPIPQIRDRYAWISLTTGAWCWDSNDSANGSVYRKLYNWYAVNDPRGLAPEGWHIPSDKEWKILAIFLGGQDLAGGKMKETGTSHWLSPNTDATNSSGFRGLPGGYRNKNGTFLDNGSNGYWWSSTETGPFRALYTNLSNLTGYLNRNGFNKVCGFSVRCIQD